MVRLILQFEITDGYTYHCTETRPVVHTSKEDAAKEFEQALSQKIDQFFEIAEHNNALDVKINKLRAKLTSVAKPSGSAIDALTALYQERQNFDPRFQFSGLLYDMTWFVSDMKDSDKSYALSMPQMFTLDEYFRRVESN